MSKKNNPKVQKEIERELGGELEEYMEINESLEGLLDNPYHQQVQRLEDNVTLNPVQPTVQKKEAFFDSAKVDRLRTGAKMSGWASIFCCLCGCNPIAAALCLFGNMTLKKPAKMAESKNPENFRLIDSQI